MNTSMTAVITRPRAGVVDDIERDFEPDDAFTALLAQLRADGDRRAAAAGRRAPRTVAEMLARQRAVAQVCCGRAMEQDGSQLVCRKCGAWIDPGVVPGATAVVMGGEQDDQPEPQRREQEWILDHHRAATAADEACGLCGFWQCRCHNNARAQWNGNSAQAMTDAEREALEEKVREANRQSTGANGGKNG
ncbi:hypothetical protein [Streptomyces olivaceiscleroticus]